MPLGIWQICTYAKSGQLKADVKTVKFWIWWVVCFLPVIASVRLLLGTVKHMLAMGSQTIYADGIARFGQMVPEDFLPYIGGQPIRLLTYDILSYLILISIIWLSVAMFLQIGKNNHVHGFIALGLSLMLLVGFSFTVVRMDYDDLYARSEGLVRAAFVIVILFMGYFYHFKSFKRDGILKISIFY